MADTYFQFTRELGYHYREEEINLFPRVWGLPDGTYFPFLGENLCLSGMADF